MSNLISIILRNTNLTFPYPCLFKSFRNKNPQDPNAHGKALSHFKRVLASPAARHDEADAQSLPNTPHDVRIVGAV